MIDTRADTGITVISICKYDDYQGDDPDDDTVDAELATSDRQATDKPATSDRHKTEELKHSRREEGNLPQGEPGLFALGGQALVKSVKPARKSRHEYTPEFEDWWPRYPRKEDKPAAFKAYQRVLSEGRGTVPELAAGADRYALERRSENPKFTKHPSTWLNNDAWNNQPAASGHQMSAATAGMESYLKD